MRAITVRFDILDGGCGRPRWLWSRELRTFFVHPIPFHARAYLGRMFFVVRGPLLPGLVRPLKTSLTAQLSVQL